MFRLALKSLFEDKVAIEEILESMGPELVFVQLAEYIAEWKKWEKQELRQHCS